MICLVRILQWDISNLDCWTIKCSLKLAQSQALTLCQTCKIRLDFLRPLRLVFTSWFCVFPIIARLSNKKFKRTSQYGTTDENYCSSWEMSNDFIKSRTDGILYCSRVYCLHYDLTILFHFYFIKTFSIFYHRHTLYKYLYQMI